MFEFESGSLQKKKNVVKSSPAFGVHAHGRTQGRTNTISLHTDFIPPRMGHVCQNSENEHSGILVEMMMRLQYILENLEKFGQLYMTLCSKFDVSFGDNLLQFKISRSDSILKLWVVFLRLFTIPRWQNLTNWKSSMVVTSASTFQPWHLTI